MKKDFFLNIGRIEKQEGYVQKFEAVSKRTHTLLEKIAALTQDDPHLPGDVNSAVQQAKSAYGKLYYKFHRVDPEGDGRFRYHPPGGQQVDDPF